MQGGNKNQKDLNKNSNQIYKTKAKKISGRDYREMRKQALIYFGAIEKQTKRRPYIRSSYFKKEKIFFDFFWDHLWQKSAKERYVRLQYFMAAVELIKNSKNQPKSEANRHKSSEILYRFSGLTNEGDLFYAQIKEDSKTKRKYLMSCFPVP